LKEHNKILQDKYTVLSNEKTHLLSQIIDEQQKHKLFENVINQKQMEINNNHKELLKYEIKYKQLYGDNDMLKQLTTIEQCAEIESILRQSLIKIEERKV
jgi:hypothetical protein